LFCNQYFLIYLLAAADGVLASVGQDKNNVVSFHFKTASALLSALAALFLCAALLASCVHVGIVYLISFKLANCSGVNLLPVHWLVPPKL
jgi:hypothetical protein